MAHNLSSFAFTGETAWHGLGEHLEAGASLETWSKSAGFNFTVKEAVVSYCDDAGGAHKYAERKVLYHSVSKQPLSVVSDAYRVVQPTEVLEFFRDLTTDQGFTMETAGVLKCGRVYFALARTGREGTVGKYAHKQFVLLATACDGSLSTTAMLTDVRVVCNNTLTMALNDRDDKVRTRHSTKFEASDAKRKLGLLAFDETATAMYEIYNQLAGVKVTYQQSHEIFAEILSPTRAAEAMNDNNARAIRGLDQLEQCYARAPGAEIGTLYGMLQGVTFYVDHFRGGANSNYSAMFAQGRTLKERAFNVLQEKALVLA